VEEGVNVRYVQRIMQREEDPAEGGGAGGVRVSGVTGHTSEDHLYMDSVKRQRASAWFAIQKETNADEPPNEEGAGVFQIPHQEYSAYYNDFAIDMFDLMDLGVSDVPSLKVWKDVWDTEHPDLVMRVQMNVDAKDKVGLSLNRNNFDCIIFNFLFI
jgi:hypothetical protein